MHNLDRTTLDNSEFEYAYDQEFEWEDEYEGDTISIEEEAYNDYEDEYEYEEALYGEEMDEEDDLEVEPALEESDEYELASELLNVSSDEELEYFLHEVRKKVARRHPRLKKRMAQATRSPRGRATRKRSGGLFKKLAKGALKIGGSAVGAALGGPLGAKIGRAAGKGVGKMMGLELEGMSPEDQEFEVAKRLTRFQAETEKQLAKDSKKMPPKLAVKRAAKKAAAKHLPGLVAKKGANRSQHGKRRPQKGIWYRNQAGNIVLKGI